MPDGAVEVRYRPYGAALELFYSRDPEVLLDGPADTGKSRACLEKLYICGHKYERMRALICRKTRKSLTQAGMVSFEQKVLPPRSLVKFHSTKQAYVFPNKSELVVGGLDDPIKVQSAEYDLIYVQEATELTENDWEMISKLLRNGMMPYQQLLADCNPGPPSHWLNKRCNNGNTRRLLSRHTDNPSITEERLNRLKALTGVRRLRLYDGIWAAAEGMVYDTWDPAIHIIDRFPVPKTWRIVAGVDWGFTNPGCIQVWAIDGDDRAYLIHEIYRVQRKISWWIEEAKKLKSLYGIDVFYCDPSGAAYISDFNDNFLNAIPADNDVAPGIQEVQERLAIQEDGLPRLFVFRDALEERDQVRDDNRQPCGLIEEREGYIWKQNNLGVTEEPVKENDHSEDTCRYALYSISPKGNKGNKQGNYAPSDIDFDFS